MNIKGFFPLILAVALVIAGCGGTGSDQSSSLTFDMAVLQVGEGNHIEGTVYNDLNGNSVMDMREPGITGVTVTLVGVAATLTDAMGQYVFGDIAPGAYTVVETDPAGFVSITPNTVIVQVSDTDVIVDFGDKSNVVSSFIFGFVYDDLNEDEVMDMGESGIPGVMMSLGSSRGTTDAMTASDGSYAFGVMMPGTYSVVETDPNGYVSTTPNEIVVQIIDMDVQVNFGDRFVEEIDVDVKPGSDVNPLNLKSNGVLPVAILGSETFDVTQIDPDSLLLNGVPPLRWSYEDVCGSDDMLMEPDMDGDNGEAPDGYEDMTLKFSTQEIAASLGEVQRGDIVRLSMTGALLDGTLVSGEETVWIVQIPK